MKYNVITITREFGSGGRTIGRALAQELGYDFYDFNLVWKIAQESGFAFDFVESHSEDAISHFFPFAFNNYASGASDQLYVAQRNVIRQLAEKGNCIIVGRCSDYVLRDREDTLHVYIHADKESRMRRVVNVYGENDVAIDKRIETKDKQRIAYYQFYTDRKWGRAKNYHVCLDSGRLGEDMCVQILSRMVQE